MSDAPPSDGGSRQMDQALADAEIRGMRRALAFAREHAYAEAYSMISGGTEVSISWSRVHAVVEAEIKKLQESGR